MLPLRRQSTLTSRVVDSPALPFQQRSGYYVNPERRSRPLCHGGSGGNSGFQALNLAVQFGARQIAFVGLDVHTRSGPHWYGRNEWSGANNPGEANFRRWRRAFAVAARTLSNMGIDVANATRFSDVKEFRFVPSVEVALQEWKM